MSASFSGVGVIGAGQMGAGIAQVCATAGIPTKLYDSRPESVEKSMAFMKKLLNKQVEKGKLENARVAEILGLITVASTLKEVAETELVIEAIIEDIQIKKELFTSLDALCSENTIIASNTSSISITALAAATKRADRFIGLHFMNPVPVMELVEVIRGLQTSEET
ncbi:UNVERIFIED_CONTAM: hypothetical protein GTU68_025445, partial [Idotea baltica]|nr:hypothetical protein [Idotea baltica]